MEHIENIILGTFWDWLHFWQLKYLISNFYTVRIYISQYKSTFLQSMKHLLILYRSQKSNGILLKVNLKFRIKKYLKILLHVAYLFEELVYFCSMFITWMFSTCSIMILIIVSLSYWYWKLLGGTLSPRNTSICSELRYFLIELSKFSSLLI